MSNQRIVNAALFVFGIVVFVVFNQLLTQIWEQFQFSEHKILGPIGIPLSISLVLTAIGIFLLTRHQDAMPFLLEVVAELKEVTWPTAQETRSHTVVVVTTTIIVAVILGGFDWTWAKISKLLLSAKF